MSDHNQDPWDEGREAYGEGLPLSACPYEEISQDAVTEWYGGWMAGIEDDDDDA